MGEHFLCHCCALCAEQHCSSEQQAGLCQGNPSALVTAHGCPWQADVSLALAQRCFWSCLNNSSLRAHASLSKGMLHWELTARSPHSASLVRKTCTGTKAARHAALQTPGRVNKFKCLTQTPLSHFAPGVCSAAAGFYLHNKPSPGLLKAQESIQLFGRLCSYAQKWKIKGASLEEWKLFYHN